MPWTDAGLPFSGDTPPSRHTSHAGAEDAKPRAENQTIRYLAILKAHGPLTDREAAKLLGIERTSVNARRAPLVKAGIVGPKGFRRGPGRQIKNVVWGLL